MAAETIKGIAALCGVDERTVRRWIDALCTPLGGMSREAGHDARPLHAIKQKTLAASAAGTAATFDLPETLAIIRAGGNNTLADLLADNARRKPAITLDEPRDSLDPALRLHIAKQAVDSGLYGPAQALAIVGLPPRSETASLPHLSGRQHSCGTVQVFPQPYDRGLNMLNISTPSAFPVTAVRLEKYLGASRMTFLRWGERLGFRPPWTREQAIEIWSAIHRKRLPE